MSTATETPTLDDAIEALEESRATLGHLLSPPEIRGGVAWLTCRDCGGRAYALVGGLGIRNGGLEAPCDGGDELETCTETAVELVATSSPTAEPVEDDEEEEDEYEINPHRDRAVALVDERNEDGGHNLCEPWLDSDGDWRSECSECGDTLWVTPSDNVLGDALNRDCIREWEVEIEQARTEYYRATITVRARDEYDAQDAAWDKLHKADWDYWESGDTDEEIIEVSLV